MKWLKRWMQKRVGGVFCGEYGNPGETIRRLQKAGLTAGRVARCALQEKKQLWWMRRSAAVLAFVSIIAPPSSFASRATHRGFG
jgi:hypothetical protein